MNKPKGGRGKSAPYDTKLMRVPVPISEQVNQIVERYQRYLEDGGDASNSPDFLETENKFVNSNSTPDAIKPVNNLPALFEALEKLVDKINDKESGYRVNSFSQGREELIKIIGHFKATEQ